jgi:hypothetical protein
LAALLALGLSLALLRFAPGVRRPLPLAALAGLISFLVARTLTADTSIVAEAGILAFLAALLLYEIGDTFDRLAAPRREDRREIERQRRARERRRVEREEERRRAA